MIKTKQSNNRLIILLVIMLVLFNCISPMETFCATNEIIQLGEKLNESVIEELDEIDFSGFNEVILTFQESGTNIFDLSNVKDKVYDIITGENAVDYTSFLASIFSSVIQLVVRYLPLLSLIIAIGVISNMLSAVKSKFNEKSTSNLIHIVCFLSIVTIVVGIVSSLAINVGKSVNLMVKQMNVTFPILLTLMIGLGANASAGVFQPVVAILTTYVADFFSYFIIPLFMISFVFGIISNLSPNIKLDKFNSFISSLFKWSVGLIFTLFFAIFTIQGISAGTFDSVSLRTTKYTIKSYVPIMGGYLSDGMDLILASTILIKNSVGLVGLLMVITTILAPILEIIIFSLMLKLISAVLQPMGNNQISNFLMSSSKSVIMLSSSIIAIGFMYLISIGLIMTTSNVVI